MIVNKILRYLCGYVHFKAENGFTERLINLCASNNISLNKIKKTPEGFEAITLLHEFKKVEVLAKKANVEVYKVNEKGIPSRAGKYKRRWGMMIGICVLFLFLVISQSFVWQIEVKGNEKVSTNLILSELKQEGIHKWSYIPKLNFFEKKQKLMLRLPELSWISVNISGCKLNVSVSERYMPPMINENTPCDIVASKTGHIRYMEVYNGVVMTKVNYTVNEGDLIVSGKFLSKQGKELLIHADAKVIAEVQFDKALEIDIDQLSKEYTGKVKNRYYVDFLSSKLPLFISTKMKGNFDIIETKNPMMIFSKELPLGITKKQYKFYSKKKDALSQEQAKEILRDSFKQYELVELKDSVILNKEETVSMKNGVMRMTMSYIVEQDIAKRREIM